MAKTWMDPFHECYDVLYSEAVELEGLAHAFSRVGNKMVADELMSTASRLKSSAEKIKKAIGEKCYSDLCAGQEAAGNMIGAALAVAKMKK